MPDLLSTTAGPGALSAPAPQRGEVPPGRSFTAAGFSVLLPPSLGPGPRTTRGQSSQTCTLLPNHAAPGLLPSAGRGCGALGLDNSEDALPPTESLTDPRLDSRPVRIDAPRTAYRGYLPPHQPSSEASTVCFVPPRADTFSTPYASRYMHWIDATDEFGARMVRSGAQLFVHRSKLAVVGAALGTYHL